MPRKSHSDIEESKEEPQIICEGQKDIEDHDYGGRLVRLHRINEINYNHDPRVYDEYVEELYPSRSMVSVKKIKSKGLLGQRIISEGFLQNSQSCSEFDSDGEQAKTEEVQIVCQSFKPGADENEFRDNQLNS